MNKEEICMSEDLEDKIVTGTVMEQIVLTRDNCKELLEYIKDLQKKAELGEHYKHLYSEVKKQKDDGIDWIKNNYCYVGKKMTLKPFSDLKDLLRMLGEIDVED